MLQQKFLEIRIEKQLVLDRVLPRLNILLFPYRPQFEEYISAKRFIEHGEYDKQYYGTSLDAVRTVINSGKICVLNLQPVSLQILHDSDLKPYVVFLTPPTLQTYRQQRAKYGEPCRVS